MIKNIIFDVGDTLFESMHSRIDIFDRILKKFGIRTTRVEIWNVWNMFKFDAQIGKISHREAEDDFLKYFMKSAWNNAIKLLQDADAKRKYVVFPGVKPTLTNLKKRGFKIGVLTDSTYTAENRRVAYQKLGINEYLDYVATSHDIHAVKPDPKAFKAILKKMKAKRSESVFVGHAKDELDGARRFGLVTIGFNLDKDARANFVAEKFSDIIKIIGELND